MRALDFAIIFIMLGVSIAAASVINPTYTMQKNAEGASALQSVANYQISLVGSLPAKIATVTASTSPIDWAIFFAQLGWSAMVSLFGLITILFVSAPMLTLLFPIPPEVAAIFNVVITISVLLAFVQVVRGGTTKWNE